MDLERVSERVSLGLAERARAVADTERGTCGRDGVCLQFECVVGVCACYLPVPAPPAPVPVV